MSDNESVESQRSETPDTKLPDGPVQPGSSRFHGLEYTVKVLCALLYAYHEVILPSAEESETPGGKFEEAIQIMICGLTGIFVIAGVSVIGICHYGKLLNEAPRNANLEAHNYSMYLSCQVNLLASCGVLLLGASYASSTVVLQSFLASLPLIAAWHMVHMLFHGPLLSYAKRRFGHGTRA